MATITTAAVSFGVTTIVLFLSFRQLDRYWRTVRGRLRSLGNESYAPEDERSAYTSRNRNLLVRLLPEVEKREDLKKRLACAGFYSESAPDLYVLCQILAVTLSIASVAILVGSGLVDGTGALLVFATLICAAVSHLPSLWLRRATQQQKRRYRKSIPDLLDLMVVCLDGGMSLPFTLKRASSELQVVHPELASELLIVQRDAEMGATLEQALQSFAQRADDDEVKTLSLFVGEAQRHGSSITDALREHADFVRSQRETAAEEMAQKASVKILMPLLLLILPAVFVVVAGPAVIQLTEAFAEE